MKITILPPQDAPKQSTASCKEIRLAQMNGGDLVINQKRKAMWSPDYSDFEGGLAKIIAAEKQRRAK